MVAFLRGDAPLDLVLHFVVSQANARPEPESAVVQSAMEVASKAARVMSKSRGLQRRRSSAGRGGGGGGGGNSGNNNNNNNNGEEEEVAVCMWRTPPAVTPSALHVALATPVADTNWGCCRSLLRSKASLSEAWLEASPAIPLVCRRRCVLVAPAVTMALVGHVEHSKELLQLEPTAATSARYFDDNTLLHVAAFIGDLDLYDTVAARAGVDVGARNASGRTAEELLSDRFGVDLPLLRQFGGYPEDREPFAFDVEMNNIRSLFAAQEPTLWGGRALTHGQLQSLLQDMATFPQAEELFLDLADDMWAAWNEAGDVDFAGVSQSVAHQIDYAKRKGIRGIVLADVVALVRRCHGINWAQERTTDILGKRAAAQAKVLDDVRNAVRTITELTPHQLTRTRKPSKAGAGGRPGLARQPSYRGHTDYALIAAVREHPEAIPALKAAVDAAVAYREKVASEEAQAQGTGGGGTSPPSSSSFKSAELDQAQELLEFVLQSNAVVTLQRHVRGMAGRARVAHLAAEKRHSRKASTAFDDAMGGQQPATIAADETSHATVEEQHLAQHFNRLQDLRKELHTCSATVATTLDNINSGSARAAAMDTDAVGLQHVEVTSRLLVKHLRATRSYIREHLVDDELAAPGVVDEIIDTLAQRTEALAECRSALNAATISDLHQRHHRASDDDGAQATTTSGSSSSSSSGVDQASEALQEAFRAWLPAFKACDGKFNGVVVSVDTDPDTGASREVLQRVTKTVIEEVDAEDAKQASKRKHERAPRRQPKALQQQQQPAEDEQKSTATTDDADVDAASPSMAPSPSSRSNTKAPRGSNQQQQQQQAGSPRARDAAKSRNAAAAAADDDDDDDQQLMRVINEEMELRQLQTVLAESQLANHREVSECVSERE